VGFSPWVLAFDFDFDFGFANCQLLFANYSLERRNTCRIKTKTTECSAAPALAQSQQKRWNRSMEHCVRDSVPSIRKLVRLITIAARLQDAEFQLIISLSAGQDPALFYFCFLPGHSIH